MNYTQDQIDRANQTDLVAFLQAQGELLERAGAEYRWKKHESIKSKITDLDKMKIEEQKKAVRSGYDMEIIPSDLATFGGEAKRLLQDLQTRNERMFLVTIILMNTASSRQKLENAVFQTASIAQKYNCALKRLDFQQEEGLMSSLPIGINHVEIERGLTTSSTAIFVPFTTQELFQHGEALYYGLNALSNNMIMVDRKQLKNPNGLILGTPGSGKSFSAKREMTNAFLITDDDIIVCDPEAEYYPLVQKLGGQVIRISPISPDYINPLDINVNYSEEENPLTLKSDFITDTLDSFIDKEQMMHCADFPFAEAEDNDETVTLSKEKYDLMIEDLLTMAELIEMVSDMRTKDVRVIGELGKYVPAFAAFEKGRLSLYREAAKEAEGIVERWDEELDDGYEPDEYFSD